jgi:multiple sugar transport system substrate-binding protein
MKIFNWSALECQRAPGSHSRFRTRPQLAPILLGIGAALILCGQFYAAPPAPDTKADLVLFDFGDAKDKQIREAAIARFNKRYPNVKVVDQFNPITSWSDYLDKLLTLSVSGKAPDLIHIATEGVQLGVQKRLLRPLNEFAENDSAAKESLSDSDPALVKSVTIDNKFYLLPVAWNNMMIYYNTRVFEEAGIPRPGNDWTWEDFLEIAKKLTSGSGPQKRFGFGIPYFNFGLTPFWYSAGTSVLKDDLKEANLDDPKFLEAVKFLHSLVYEHSVSPDPANTDPNAVFQLFAAGKIAMTGGGHWPMQFFASNNFKDFDVLPWPKKASKSTVFGVDGWGISPKTKNPELAWELLKELAGVESQRQAAGSGVAIPARRSVAESEEFLKQPASAKLFYESLSYAQPVQAPRNYSDVERIFMRHLGTVMANEVTPENALKEAQAELSAAMESAR